jgi:hypothetical protein
MPLCPFGKSLHFDPLQIRAAFASFMPKKDERPAFILLDRVVIGQIRR